MKKPKPDADKVIEGGSVGDVKQKQQQAQQTQGWSRYTGMGRTGSTIPAVHTSPRKFKTCNGLEVLFL